MATTLTAIALELNGSTAITATNTTLSTGSTYGLSVSCDNMSKLVILGYNSDTGTCTDIVFACSDSHYIRRGLTALSTSISSSAYVWFGPFDSMQYKSSSGTLEFGMGSTTSTKVSWFAFTLP
jgi:hypothetical protein